MVFRQEESAGSGNPTRRGKPRQGESPQKVDMTLEEPI